MDIAGIHQILSSWATSKPLVDLVWIFGSRARGNHRPDSDLDIAIQLDLSAADGVDESGGLATWMLDTGGWEEELAALLPFTIDLEQYRGDATPTIRRALATSSQLVYTKRAVADFNAGSPKLSPVYDSPAAQSSGKAPLAT